MLEAQFKDSLCVLLSTFDMIGMFSGTLEHVLNMFNRTLEGILYPVVYFPLSFSVNIKQLETDLFWPLKGLIFLILNKTKILLTLHEPLAGLS